MAGFDRRQVNRMRQEAIRRSKEMYSRAGLNTPKTEENLSQSPQLPGPAKDKLSGLIDELFGGSLDGDKLLIAALLLLLIREGADIKLILALGYILL